MAEIWGEPLEPGTFVTENPPATLGPILQRLRQGPNDLSIEVPQQPTPPNRAESREKQ